MVWTFKELLTNMWSMFKYIMLWYMSMLAVRTFLAAAR